MNPFWLGLKRRIDNGLDLVWPKGGLASSARRHFPQAVDTLLRKAPSPQHDCLSIDLQLLSDGTVGSTGSRGQHDPAAQGHLLGSTVSSHPLLHLQLLGRRQLKSHTQGYGEDNILSSYLLDITLDNA